MKQRMKSTGKEQKQKKNFAKGATRFRGLNAASPRRKKLSTKRAITLRKKKKLSTAKSGPQKNALKKLRA